MTYPLLPTKGGNPNAEAPEGVVQGMTVALQQTRQQAAHFRAQQYARRLRTRGAAAMRETPPTPADPEPTPAAVPDDPVAQLYVAAGWL